MEYAKRFLTDGHSVGECAHLVGYEDEFNFSKSFKRHFGISPSQIRREV
jgi:AraC-like DNA-binding protein